MMARWFTGSAMWAFSLAFSLALFPGLLHAGVDEGMARYVPWSGSFWPIREGALIRGPLTKYDQVTGHEAAAWELRQNPPDPAAPEWFGYCHAWAAASILDREPLQLRSGQGLDGTPVPLGIGDQKGMLTACHTDDVAQHYGVRFDGQPGEDDQDIYPDQLWRVLKLYIQQRGVPLIVDIEGGTQVWNYPVYAYRVDYRPAGSGGLYQAEMTLWMADDSVPEDIVGVKVSKQTYYFTFELRDGAAQLGTGRWVEPSVHNHPDFAWYPYVVRAENPELHYDKVKQLVDSSASGPTGEPPPTATPDQPGETTIPLENQAENPLVPHLPPNVLPRQPDRYPALAPDGGAAPPDTSTPGAPQPRLLSPVELLSLVSNQTSQFILDVTVDKFDGGRYLAGEALSVAGTCERDAYLYLFYLDNQGGLAVLFPGPGESNLVQANRRFHLPRPDSGRTFRAANVPGVHRIKAITTTAPLMFSGLSMAPGNGPDRAGHLGGFRLPPSQETMYRQQIIGHLAGKRLPSKALGGETAATLVSPFAQDEVAFYVGAADAEIPSSDR